MRVERAHILIAMDESLSYTSNTMYINCYFDIRSEPPHPIRFVYCAFEKCHFNITQKQLDKMSTQNYYEDCTFA